MGCDDRPQVPPEHLLAWVAAAGLLWAVILLPVLADAPSHLVLGWVAQTASEILHLVARG